MSEELKTPKILIPALRQYQHNDCSGLLAGFDHNETIKIISFQKKGFLKRALKVVDNRIKTIRGDVGFIAEESIIKALKDEFEND